MIAKKMTCINSGDFHISGVNQHQRENRFRCVTGKRGAPRILGQGHLQVSSAFQKQGVERTRTRGCYMVVTWWLRGADMVVALWLHGEKMLNDG